MAREEAFLAEILAAPHDDTTRLVFADWLEDRDGPGDAAWAEFIRLSVGDPETTFWPPGSQPSETIPQTSASRAASLCRDNWKGWTERLRLRLGSSPLRRWLGSDDCSWAYRRGFVAVFEGTQQVLLDAWDDLFRLGPIEMVQVNNLGHFGTVLSLRQFLDQPSLRVLELHARELRDDDVDQLRGVSDWLRRLHRVELFCQNPGLSAVDRLLAWLSADQSLQHVYWPRDVYPDG